MLPRGMRVRGIATLAGALATLVLLAAAPAGAGAQLLGGHGSTGLRTCDNSGCRTVELAPVGLPVMGTTHGVVETAACLSPTKVPIEGIGEVGVCDPPPVFGPGYLVPLVRADALGHEVKLETTTLGSALMTSHGVRLTVDDASAEVETICSYYPPESGDENSFCIP
jgi:hypothetical protein